MCVCVSVFICVCSSCFQPLELQHVAAACQTASTSENHPLNTVFLSPCLCAIFFSPFLLISLRRLKVLCAFPAGNLEFGIICLEAQIKNVNSVSSFLSLPQTTFCMLASFFMFSPPWGSFFFYVALISLVLVMVSDALCSVYTDFTFTSHHHVNLV